MRDRTMENQVQTFRKFLETAFDQGHYATDDVIAFVMPLFEEVLSFHEADQVGPFEKPESLFITDGRLDINEAFAHSQKDNISRVLALFESKNSTHFDIVESLKVDTDIDSGVQSVKNLKVHLQINEPILHPAYVPGYLCYEHLIGHHDAQTDIFCLGLILGSITLELDLYDPEDISVFADQRTNPVRFNSRIHPTISSLITEMTELDRSKRTSDLYDVIHKLKHYRDFDPLRQTDLSNVAGWVNKELIDKNQIVLSKLRNRLFDTSHRNRLLYYKPNMRFMNLTVSSVPMVLHYQSIRPELLFTWNMEISGKVKGMKDIILNKYLRFEDHQYLPSSLDKIRVEAQRDVHEYGFSQLKLVITFLNWHNLKEDQRERIQSPLLLIPVELKRNKKLKEDHYVLKILDNEAEVNPVLSNYLRDLYGIKLPDFVDLDEMSLEQFYNLLKEQIDGANQGITLNYIDKPRIKLIHSVAKQTVGNFKKRLNRNAGRLASYKDISYSYQNDLFKPLGLEIFRQRIEPRSTFLEFLINEDINISSHQFTGQSVTKERQLYEMTDSESNPHRWDFDLCNIVLGNFNYKKMSLVRDYNHVIDKQIKHEVFETLFSNLPRQQRVFTSDLDQLENWKHVITADPTQTKAVLQSHSGESYIIQGPPGTGKSQTITNLIADFVARGKSVLFVCEKRAALDVVYHRLKQCGLDELCCYIHDSQGDKREFIRNLKTTYEDFIGVKFDVADVQRKRSALQKQMEEQLDIIRHFHQTNNMPHEGSGLAVRELLEKVVALKDNLVTVDKREQENFPDYQDWLKYGKSIEELETALIESGVDTSFSQHPFSRLQEHIFLSDKPYQTLSDVLKRSAELLNEIQRIVNEFGLGQENVNSLSQLKCLLAHAQLLNPLVENNKLYLLDVSDARTQAFEQTMNGYRKAQQDYQEKVAANSHWQNKFSKQDTLTAWELAKKYEPSFFSFFHVEWRNLKKQIRTQYDFSKHLVKPPIANVLQLLQAEYDAQDVMGRIHNELQDSVSVVDITSFYENLQHVVALKETSEMALILNHQECQSLVKKIVKLDFVLSQAETNISSCLKDSDIRFIYELQDDIENITLNLDSLIELIPALRSIATLPKAIKYIVRTMDLSARQVEAVMANRSLEKIYKNDWKFKTTTNATIEKAIQFIESGYAQLLKLNAELIRATIRHRFLSHVELSAMAISQLNTEQRAFKKEYNEGRKILENEFGKSMRYKSIRELSGKESGLVLKDLKPVWLMSPLSVSDSLPLNTNYFDAIIFDEASQITLEEGIPSLYRAPQTIIVGDEKQMPPSNFFTTKTEDPDDLEAIDNIDDELLSNDADSLLVQGARKLNSVMLGWHYRSRYETLISYSNHAFYDAGLLTIPDKAIHHKAKAPIEVKLADDAIKYVDALLDRSISFHHLPNSVYEKRANLDEANYIAHLVMQLLKRGAKESIGIVAFSQEQQNTIEDALTVLATRDKEFGQYLEEAYVRTEEDQFVGLFVKNLENVQGDERDIIIMSVCYGFDARKRMIMNFGPINKKGGEKRLNVIFSRAKKHMAIVSSIKHFNITNEYNEGANYFKRFLQYAELISEGNTQTARTILDSLVMSKRDRTNISTNSIVLKQVQQALINEGFEVEQNVGQSDFKCSLGVKLKPEDEEYTLSVLLDDAQHYQNQNLIEQYYQRPAILQSFGWRVIHVFVKDWLDHPKKVIKTIIKRMTEEPVVSTYIAETVPSVDAVLTTGDEIEQLEETKLPIQESMSDATLVFQRLEFTDTTSNKFWEIAIDVNKVIVRFGRIGTKGQTQIKSFASVEAAQKEKDKMIKEKQNKGYRLLLD